mmetsp:Transcript_21802/g.65345  ORF Transcript_21802/g.65345 Transcript_21802/m.65345 type:complete len:360 (+) Transcript_21802:152-1231(+)
MHVTLAALMAVAAAFQAPQRAPQPRRSAALAAEKRDVMKCLVREYRSFFAPLESEYYTKDVTFDDPLSSLSGLNAYRNNVDMLAGRTLLGKFLFRDASIALHDVKELDDGRLRTRWTLRVCFQALPWAPVARFTGISEYALNGDNIITGQTDYWDSIDLQPGGTYARSPKLKGVSDFIDQLFGATPASDGELPYELLRRAEGYAVRRYPAVAVAEVAYEARPEGYDVLGSFCGGFNEAKEKLTPFLPSIITVPRSGGAAKTMTWPVSLDTKALPGSKIVKSRIANAVTVACLTFPQAATEEAVRYYARELEKKLAADGLEPAPGHDDNYVVAQYDAIFSVGDRRNEIWIPLADGHPWDG